MRKYRFGLAWLGHTGRPLAHRVLADFDEFAADANYWSGFTRLETDVNLAGRAYTTAVIAPDVNDADWDFDGTAFTGAFDGNDHKIAGLTIDDGGAGNDYLWLFGCIREDGEVRNLRLEGGSVSGLYYIGGLVADNRGSISSCYSAVDVNGVGEVGGLVGLSSYTASISNCYSTGDVNGTDDCVGGLVGQNGYSSEDVYFGYIVNSYSTGIVQGSSDVAGLVGYNRYGDIERSFWDVETSGESNMCGHEDDDATGCEPNCGKTTAQMQTKSTFTEAAWDFVEIWLINEGATYPVLRKEIRSDLNGIGGVDLADFAIFADHWLEGTAD